jgi:aspartyl-tRNA(Asn)/glutamyl-tRNA(Gln) amidotransferase subunit C
MPIDRATVEHVARLSRLELREEEVERLTEELRRIVAYVEKLSRLDVETVEPMAHAASGEALLREDTPAESLARKDALTCAPSARDGFFVVPPVIEG